MWLLRCSQLPSNSRRADPPNCNGELETQPHYIGKRCATGQAIPVSGVPRDVSAPPHARLRSILEFILGQVP